MSPEREAVATLVVDNGAIGDLGTWLDAQDELRGHVRREPDDIPEGALGAGLGQIALTLASDGAAATAAASVIIAWLRRRTGSVSVRVSRPDGSLMELHAERVRALDQAELQAHVDQLAAIMRRET